MQTSTQLYHRVLEQLCQSSLPHRNRDAHNAAVPVVSFSPAVAEQWTRLRHDLKAQGRRGNSRALDLIIAATALEHNLTLVTRNTDDYQEIPNLEFFYLPVYGTLLNTF